MRDGETRSAGHAVASKSGRLFGGRDRCSWSVVVVVAVVVVIVVAVMVVVVVVIYIYGC